MVRRVPVYAVCILLASILLTGCIDETTSDDGAASPTGYGPSHIVRFLAIGDQGTGQEAQVRVAGAMKDVCAARGCDFIITNGDNIYESGVVSEFDPQFDVKFETPYRAIDLPFYLSLGNHDNGVLGDTTLLGDFQVRYHYRTDRASDKWQMPARYYQHDHGHVSFFAMDTNILDMDGDPLNPLTPSGTTQVEWLRDVVAQSNATWKIVYGHHPYISNGEHGDGNAKLHERMEESLCGTVDILMTGHEHDMQWLLPVESCGNTEFIISGAAGKTRSLRDDGGHDAFFGQGDTYGFMWIEIVDDAFTGVFFDDSGKVLFERTVTKAQLADPVYGEPLH